MPLRKFGIQDCTTASRLSLFATSKWNPGGRVDGGYSELWGSNKKSAQQHRLQGTYRKSRHATAADPRVPEGVPVPPKALSGDAEAEWRRMVARMQSCQTLAVVDDAALYEYVMLFAETEALVTEQSKMGALIERLDGEIAELEQPGRGAAMTQLIKLKQIESRFPSQIRQSRMALRQYLIEFGMTPSARTRVKTSADAPMDEWSEFDRPIVQ